MLFDFCDKVNKQVEFQKGICTPCKLQKGRDKFMTTTFKSVAILREGKSAIKPCEAGHHTDASGVLLKTPNRAGNGSSM